MRFVLAGLTLILALSCAAPAFAQDCKTPVKAEKADEVLIEIGKRRGIRKCYDIAAHPEPSLADAAKMLDKAKNQAAPAERLQTVAGLLQWLREWMNDGIDEAPLRDELQRRVSDARVALSLAQVSNQAMQPSSWRIKEGANRSLTSNVVPTDFSIYVRRSCTEKPAWVKACESAIADLEATHRTHEAIEVALGIASADALADLTELFANRAKMWDAYRTEARPQYPWEWVLNGVLFKDDRPKDTSGNPRGPANLPGGQWILLHPGVGLERFDMRNTDQSASNPTLYIEWLGYNRLNWDYDAGKLRGGLGVSLVSVYSSRQDAKDWSNGVMFWVSNKYGLAVTRNSDGTSLMVSVDVGELFRDQLNQLNQALRAGLPSK